MERSVLFVKAKSRLGLLYPPFGEQHQNVGVEKGPDYVLNDELLSLFPDKEVISYQFQLPENVRSANYYQALATDYKNLQSLILSKLSKQKILITAGGDHSVSLASISSVLQVYGAANTGVIMIDSHADIHLPQTSHSGNFHGMWMRVLCDVFPVGDLDNLVPVKLLKKNLCYLGNLEVEPEEEMYLKDNNILTYNAAQITSPSFEQIVTELLNKMEHVHVSIDIDAFSQTFAPATGMKITNGLSPATLLPILARISNHSSLSVDLVEVNPLLRGHAKTKALAHQLLTTTLKGH